MQLQGSEGKEGKYFIELSKKEGGKKQKQLERPQPRQWTKF